jgi:hypothetical protein
MIKKDYPSLTKLKEDLEKEGKCKIISFNGWALVVKCGSRKIRYGLYLGEVIETLIVEE